MKRALLIFLLMGIAHADDPPHNRPPDNRPPDRGGDVDVNVRTPVDVDVSTPVEVGVDAPVNVNTATTINRNSRAQVPNAYFSYTPNFIDCGRVLGFQYGNTNGIGSFGVPLPRDKACDIWKAVNEAQENGHILLSYAFMCEIKNIKKVWGLEKCKEITDTAGDWWLAMVNEEEEDLADAVNRFVPPPDSVVIAQEEHDDLEEELRVTQMQLGYVQNEHEEQREQQQQVQQKIQQYEQREARKQEELDAFLEELESRQQNE